MVYVIILVVCYYLLQTFFWCFIIDLQYQRGGGFMYCQECGSKLPETAKFCINCGTKVWRKEAAEEVKEVQADSEAKQVESEIIVPKKIRKSIKKAKKI